MPNPGRELCLRLCWRAGERAGDLLYCPHRPTLVAQLPSAFLFDTAFRWKSASGKTAAFESIQTGRIPKEGL